MVFMERTCGWCGEKYFGICTCKNARIQYENALKELKLTDEENGVTHRVLEPVRLRNPHDTDQDIALGKHWGRARDWEDGFDAALEFGLASADHAVKAGERKIVEWFNGRMNKQELDNCANCNDRESCRLPRAVTDTSSCDDWHNATVSEAVRKREQEIVGWLKNEFDWRSDKDFSRLEAWLKE